MNISLPKFNWPTWTRNKSGDNFYDLTSVTQWYESCGNLEMAEDHPILTPAMLFVSKLYSQAADSFYVKNTTTGKTIKNHWLPKLLKDPNMYQTCNDFLESLQFMKIAQGKSVLYIKRTTGISNPTGLHLLNYDLIDWPEGLEERWGLKRSRRSIGNEEITYDIGGENLTIKIKDLIFFYDLPNGYRKNKFKNKSRLDGLKQTLINTHDSLLAKNIILKSNGKELLSGAKEGFPMTPDEKDEAEKLFNSGYGLGGRRKRGLITKAQVTWKSLHIALRDLGLDESVKIDGNIIYTSLHIPKDILSLEAKKTTYNNFKESMVSYIQNEMQTSLDSDMAALSQLLGPNEQLCGSYEHLPIMQYILIERYKGVEQRGKALEALRRAGVQDDLAVELCGFEKGTQLNEMKQESEQNQNDGGEGEETKLRKID